MVPPAHNPLASAAFMLTAAALIAGCTLLAKVAGSGPNGLHALQISHGRFLFAFLGIAAANLLLRPRYSRPAWGLHAARSFFGWGGISLTFAAIQFIPLADATAISFLNPVVAMLLAIPLLGEKVGPWRWLAVVIAVVGGAILLRPGSGVVETGALIALAAAISMGIEITIIKLLTGREGPLQILLINNGFGLIFATLAVLAFGVWQWPTPTQWAVLAGIGTLMALAQACFIQSMRRADASFASPFFYATLVFAALYDGVFFGVWPDMNSAVGAAVILAGGGLLAWREGRRGRPARRIPG
ncbi:DMT family transporter [Maritimibacter sp. DP1N21-5]|uniref:DMT family transporter n=1 Tax=Maritimibacter sp. DP1N21-5 TaxID=2836867 RepID=UPI00351CFD27